MALVDINFNPDRDTLRSFGWVALLGFGFLAVIAWFEWLIFAPGLGAARQPLAAIFALLALVSAGLGLIWPQGNRWIYVGLALITFPIGFVLSYVIMGTLFYLVITPIGVLLRVLGKNPLERRLDPEAQTYWVDARPQRSKESYFSQF